jgi:transcriptional regulator PpsR
MNRLQAPQESLGGLDAEAAATLIAAAADVALIVDREGVIRDLAFGSDELSREGYGAWIGQPWLDTVTVESRPKVEALLQDAVRKVAPRGRQVNHPSSRGVDVPVLYSAVQVGLKGRVVALGRDLRATAALQQRLMNAQQSMEQEYSRLRHAETRYRLLFQIASEAVLILDASTQRVEEVNPAACQLLGASEKRLTGRAFPQGFDESGTQAIQGLLAKVRAAGRADEVRARLADGEQEFLVSASLFRQRAAAYFLVRLSPLRAEAGAVGVPRSKSTLLEVVERSPDGFVVTDLDGRILTANAAFLDLAQVATDEQARGETLERWLGRSGVDFNVLVTALREHGSVRLFATAVRGEYGAVADVEVSAVSVPDGEQPCLGFMIRNVGSRLASAAFTDRTLPRSVEQLTELVGSVPLKDLVRESTDLIERLCIEAALQLTGDNRASAAEILGLSRQSLYVKLRRYGLGDLAPENGKQQP